MRLRLKEHRLIEQAESQRLQSLKRDSTPRTTEAKSRHGSNSKTKSLVRPLRIVAVTAALSLVPATMASATTHIHKAENTVCKSAATRTLEKDIYDTYLNDKKQIIGYSGYPGPGSSLLTVIVSGNHMVFKVPNGSYGPSYYSKKIEAPMAQIAVLRIRETDSLEYNGLIYRYYHEDITERGIIRIGGTTCVANVSYDNATPRNGVSKILLDIAGVLWTALLLTIAIMLFKHRSGGGGEVTYGPRQDAPPGSA